MESGELGSSNTQNVGFTLNFSYLDKFRAKTIKLAKKLKKIGEDDPRRITHSFKFAFALTLVSIFYYVNPLFVSFRVSAMWAILTVIVVMEYTVGGTLSKELNRAIATLAAGALGVGAHHIAALCGEKAEPVVLGIFVFLLAGVATYLRFVPEIKARYDYGMIVFILMFSLVAVSSYRVEELTQMAHQRLSTVAIGVSISVCCSIFVSPVWAGEDLHDLVADNLDKLANILKGMEEEYFGEKVATQGLEKMLPHDYKAVFNSKPLEETLANLARWEPGHGRFHFRHPWKQYLKIGALSRQCAYSIDALHNYINSTSKQRKATIDAPQLLNKIRSASIIMTTESGDALTKLALSIRTMTVPSTTVPHIDTAIAATIKLKTILSEEESRSAATTPSAIIESAIVASILSEIVDYIHQIAISVQDLALLAHFKSSEPIHRVKPVDGEGPEVVDIIVEQ